LQHGAKFIVTPGFNPEIVEYCIQKKIDILPGCMTPSDIDKAVALGLEAVKIFPAEPIGGVKILKAISGPYGKMKYVPTGGVNVENLNSYLDFNKVIACGGSWMVPKDIIKEKRFDEIVNITKESIKLMLDFKVKHIGINTKDESGADTVATAFGDLFGFEKKVGNSSIFVSEQIEVLKAAGLGANGHIAIETRDIQRAIYYLEKQGYTFNQESTKYDKNNNMAAIYLKDEIGGFAVHLMQKK